MKVVVVIVAACLSTPSWAIPVAYRQFADAHRVDARVLYAVAKAEATRPRYPHPWPWTANVQGKPYYVESRTALYRLLKQKLHAGITNFDIGPMQINWKYNARLFKHDLWAATEPYTNIDAGATHLADLLQQTGGNYAVAVRLYHTGSLNTKARRSRGNVYAGRVMRFLKETTS